jgi:ketosteroid isomerase-like protein
MKKRLLIMSVFATACAAETVERPPPAPAHWQASAGTGAPSPTTPTEKERGVADAYTRALASPRLAALGPMLDDEVLFVFGAQTLRGRERVVAAHEKMFGAFDDRRVVASRVWLTDSRQTLNSQAIEWTMTGAQARQWMKVPPTGKNVFIKGLTLLWTTDEGVVSEIHVYFDQEVISAQLGAGPVELRKLPTASAPPGPPAINERQGKPEELSNVTTLRAMLQALEDNQESAFVSKFADDLTVVTLDEPQPLHGKETARAFFRDIHRSIGQVDTVVLNAWGVGAFAVVEYAVTGLQIASLHRVAWAKDGGLHPLHAQFVDVAEFRDGKVARLWRYSDPASFRALGAL